MFIHFSYFIFNFQYMANANQNVRVGDIIHITEMKGEPHYAGREGAVYHIDGKGYIHGSWGGCGLHPSTDTFEVIGHDDEVEEMIIPHRSNESTGKKEVL